MIRSAINPSNDEGSRAWYAAKLWFTLLTRQLSLVECYLPKELQGRVAFELGGGTCPSIGVIELQCGRYRCLDPSSDVDSVVTIDPGKISKFFSSGAPEASTFIVDDERELFSAILSALSRLPPSGTAWGIRVHR